MNRRTFLQSASVLAFTASSNAQTPPPPKAEITSSVMLWMLGDSIEQQLETAARAGYQSVELVGEHTGWSDTEITDVKKLTRSLKLGMDTISAMPDWESMPVSMVDPSQRDNLLKEVGKNIGFAKKLEIPALILISGNAIEGRTRQQQYASLLEGCKRCGELAAKANVKLIIEPLNNKVDHKGFYLTTCTEALKLIEEVDNPHVRLLFDIYHEYVQTGGVVDTIKTAVPYTEVFHIADHPGRNDPGTGEMDYPNIYKTIRESGYKGYIAMEYQPLDDPLESIIKAVDSMRAAMV